VIAIRLVNVYRSEDYAVYSGCLINPRICPGPTWTADEDRIAPLVEDFTPLAEPIDSVMRSTSHSCYEVIGWHHGPANLIPLHFGNRRKHAAPLKHSVIRNHREKIRVIMKRAAWASIGLWPPPDSTGAKCVFFMRSGRPIFS
jgi:hypothetical protein